MTAGRQSPHGRSSCDVQADGDLVALLKAQDDEAAGSVRRRNEPATVIDPASMPIATALLAPIAMLVTTCTACAITTPGVPRSASTTVVVISTVTAAPDPPVEKVFKADSVERSVAGVMRDDYKISAVGVVECPEDQPVVVATSFQCVVRIGERVKEVTITVMTADGKYVVGQPRG